MAFVRIDWHPDVAGYRGFGRAVFVGFTIIGLFLWWMWGTWAHLPWFVGLSGAVYALTQFAPRASRPHYLAWFNPLQQQWRIELDKS